MNRRLLPAVCVVSVLIASFLLPASVSALAAAADVGSALALGPESVPFPVGLHDAQPASSPTFIQYDEPAPTSHRIVPPPLCRDPACIFSPSVEQLEAWINYGIDTACQAVTEDQLHEVDRVQRRVWCQEAGMPIMTGRTLRYVIALVPEFVAITAGWEAAWNETTWPRVQTDRESLVSELARGIWLHWEIEQGNQLTFAVGIEHWQESTGSQGSMSYALYSGGRWYQLRSTPPIAHLTFARIDRQYAVATPEWAARYAMSLVPRHPRIIRPEQTYTTFATLHRLNGPRPSPDLIALVPPMPWVGPDKYVHVFGSPRSVCFFERELY